MGAIPGNLIPILLKNKNPPKFPDGYFGFITPTFELLNAFSVAKDERGPPGLVFGPMPGQQLIGNPVIGNAVFKPIFCWCNSWSFFERLLDAATNTITAITIVPQIAALAAIVILSILEEAEVTVLTSRHCEYGTFSGVTFISSKDTTHTTMHS